MTPRFSLREHCTFSPPRATNRFSSGCLLCILSCDVCGADWGRDAHYVGSFRNFEGMQGYGGASDRARDECVARWKPWRFFVRAVGKGGVAGATRGGHGESRPEGPVGGWQRTVEGTGGGRGRRGGSKLQEIAGARCLSKSQSTRQFSTRSGFSVILKTYCQYLSLIFSPHFFFGAFC